MDNKDLLEIKKLFKYPECSFSQIAFGVISSLEYEGEEAAERINYTGQNKFLTREEDEQKTFLSLLNKAFCFQESVTSLDVDVSGDIKRLLSSYAYSDSSANMALFPFMELIASMYSQIKSYAVVLFKGSYDIPIKDESKTKVGESDEVYNYIAVMICPIEAAKVGLSPVEGDIRRSDIVKILKAPLFGLLYPSFTSRSSDDSHAFVCCRGENERELATKLFSADVPTPKEKVKIKKVSVPEDFLVESFGSEHAEDIINDIQTNNVNSFKEHISMSDMPLNDNAPYVNNIDDALSRKREQFHESVEEEFVQNIEIKEDKSSATVDRVTERDINGKKYFIIPRDLLPEDILLQILSLS